MPSDITHVKLNVPAHQPLTTNKTYNRLVAEGWKLKGCEVAYNGEKGITRYLVTFTRERGYEA